MAVHPNIYGEDLLVLGAGDSYSFLRSLWFVGIFMKRLSLKKN